MGDNAYAIDLLRQVDELLAQYGNLTGRPPLDDYTVYMWAEGMTNKASCAEVLDKAIRMGEHLFEDMGQGIGELEIDAMRDLLDRMYEEEED